MLSSFKRMFPLILQVELLVEHLYCVSTFICCMVSSSSTHCVPPTSPRGSVKMARVPFIENRKNQPSTQINQPQSQQDEPLARNNAIMAAIKLFIATLCITFSNGFITAPTRHALRQSPLYEESSGETAEPSTEPTNNGGEESDILNSAAFLQRKVEVLQGDLKKLDESMEEVNAVYEANKAEWGWVYLHLHISLCLYLSIQI